MHAPPIALALACSALMTGCLGAEEAPPPCSDPDAPETCHEIDPRDHDIGPAAFTWRVTMDWLPGDITVLADGEELPATPTDDGRQTFVLERFYWSYDNARSAPLVTLETRRDGAFLDSRQIGAGACFEQTCELWDPPPDLCSGRPLDGERYSIRVHDDGTFVTVGGDPRSWLDAGAPGCLRCDGWGTTCTR